MRKKGPVMASGAGFRLFCILGGLLALGSAAAAKPALGAAAGPAGLRAPMPGVAPPGRMLARQDQALRPGHHHRRHGGYGYGHAGYGFYDARSYPQLLLIVPEAHDEPEKEAVPTVVGIARPPVADPVIYRIESRKGRQVARVIRLGADGAVPDSGGAHIVEVKPR
jgi:hypothetical protein